MTPLESALHQIASALDRFSQNWCLIGGFAVSARSEPRFTRDIDVAIAVDGDEEAEAVTRALLDTGYALAGTIEHEEVGRLATVRLIPTAQPVGAKILVDVLYASSGLEPEIVAAAERLEVLPGTAMPVARTGHLIALKVLARDDVRRPQDIADLRSLLSVASTDDLELARSGLSIITARGFHRDRDLEADLEAVLTT